MQTVIKGVRKYILMVAVTAILVALLMLFAPSTRSLSILVTLLEQGMAPALLGWGVLFNIKAGNWDFGVGAEVLIAAIVGGNAADALGLGIVGVVCCCMLAGLAAGAVSGLLYKLLRVPTIIISIALMLIYESVCGVIFGGRGVTLGVEYLVLASFPGNAVMLLLGFGLAWLLSSKLKIGYSIKAVGSNLKVAEDNGIDVVNTKAAALDIAGLFAGLYAAVSLGSSGVARTVSAMGTMGTCFNAMMCVFIGLSITGRGNVLVGIYFGAVIMQMIQMALMVFSFPTQYSQVVVALFVVAFMLASANTEGLRRLKRRRAAANGAKQ